MPVSGSLPSCRDPISLEDLLATNSYKFQLDEDDLGFQDDVEYPADRVFDLQSLQEQINFECIQTSDPTATPFEELGKKMVDIWPDGKVKKRIIKEGTVEIPDNATVRVHYNCYTEMEEVPFDSTYLRSQHPIRFKLGDGSLFIGFEIALVSMTVGEKAQFLIHPDLAFGELGCLSRIPPNATVMLIAEILRLDNLPEEDPLSVADRKDFCKIYQKAKTMNLEASKCFRSKNVHQAVIIYKKAENLLQGCSFNSDEEENQFNLLLIKIYGNLAVCYNSEQINCPKKVCVAVKMAFDVDSKIAAKRAKLFYQRGIAYMALSEYNLALRDLRRAKSLAPGDQDVEKKMELLARRMKSFEEFEEDISGRGFEFVKCK